MPLRSEALFAASLPAAAAIRHPSPPNYLALLGGSTFGITTDCTSCHVNSRNLIDRLEDAGVSWRG